MRERIKSTIKHPLISGSSIVFIGSFIANLFNYGFNLVMGRLLSIPEYGLITALSSLFILTGIFSVSFQNIITRFSAKYFSQQDEESTRAIIMTGGKAIFLFGLVLLFILFSLSDLLASFLHLDNKVYLYLIYVTIFFSLLLALPSGYLTGRMKFHLYSLVTIAHPILKLIIGVLLIFLGYGVFGALFGILASAVIPATFLFFFLYRKYHRILPSGNLDKKAFRNELTHYGYTFFLSGIGITVLQNADIILVRHYFSAYEAGLYAALSLMGKAIFYFTSPIQSVFFPLIAYKKEKNERLFSTVLFAMGIITLASTGLAFVYFAFPHIILRIFFPAEGYQVLSSYLGFFALYILVFSLASLFNNYYLSVGKTGVYKVTLTGALAQIVLLIFFHDSLYQVIGVLFGVSFFLLLLFLLYYIKYAKD